MLLSNYSNPPRKSLKRSEIMAETPPLVLVDGSSYLFRAFHALPPLTNAAGEPTGAMYGVINMLRKLQASYKPTHMAVVFDASGKTFRNDLYPEYKANRPPMPDDLRAQIAPLHEIIRRMGMPLISEPGVEADDVIGTLAVRAVEHGMKVLISTGDKDMAQLVNADVTLINTMNDALLDEDGVSAKFGVMPERIIDYLALVGDTSDNIPGVHKCGPKTAVKWLAAYDSLDGVIANASEVKGKIGEYLREALEQLPLSYKLATIKLDVELDKKPTDLTLAEPDLAPLKEYLQRYEFKAWLNELEGNVEGAQPSQTAPVPADAKRVEARDYQTILDQESLDRWLQRIKKHGSVAIDTETTSLDYMQARIVGISFCIKPGEAAYLPLAHDYVGVPAQISVEQGLASVADILVDPDIKKIGQNLKYDAHVFLNHGIEMQGIEHDTMLQSYVCDAAANRHDMDALAKKYLNANTIKFEDIAGKGKNQLTFNQIELETASEYAAEDADVSLQLHNTLYGLLTPEEKLLEIYSEIEIPLLSVLARVERAGVLVDQKKLSDQSVTLQASMDQIEALAYEEAGEEFNLGSPRQIQQILFEKKGIPVIRKTPKGQPSTAEDVLDQLSSEHLLPKLILDHRSLSKLKSTFRFERKKAEESDRRLLHRMAIV